MSTYKLLFSYAEMFISALTGLSIVTKEKTMANFVKTIATFKGPEADLDAIRSMVTKTTESTATEDGLLNQILPMPPELKEIERDIYVGLLSENMRLKDVLSIIRKDAKALNYSEASIREISANIEKAAKLQETFGYPAWYDWAKAWWNTKWDVSELRITDDIEGLLSITFHTAWSFPETPMIVLSRLFPGTQMEFRFADEDIAYGRYGSLEVKGGLVTDRHIGIDKDACAKIWGYRDYTDSEAQMEA